MFSWVKIHEPNSGSSVKQCVPCPVVNTIKVCDSGIYGAKALGEQNPNGTGDVAFGVSKDGYYLYAYFMFTNGYVVCAQFDCIDMYTSSVY